MPSVPPDVRKRRAARLRQAGDAARRRYLESRIGGTAEVLVADDETGYSEHFAPVRVPGSRSGELWRVRLVGLRQGALLGERLQRVEAGGGT